MKIKYIFFFTTFFSLNSIEWVDVDPWEISIFVINLNKNSSTELCIYRGLSRQCNFGWNHVKTEIGEKSYNQKKSYLYKTTLTKKAMNVHTYLHIEIYEKVLDKKLESSSIFDDWARQGEEGKYVIIIEEDFSVEIYSYEEFFNKSLLPKLKSLIKNTPLFYDQKICLEHFKELLTNTPNEIKNSKVLAEVIILIESHLEHGLKDIDNILKDINPQIEQDALHSEFDGARKQELQDKMLTVEAYIDMLAFVEKMKYGSINTLI